MQKTVLLINKGKSFMLVTIARSFREAGYKVVEVEPTMEDIGAHKEDTNLFLLYLGDYIDDVTNTLVYLKDICTEEDKLLIAIGTAGELESLTRSIPLPLISASFERPFDMKKLVAQADWLLEANEDLAKRKNILLVDDDSTFLKMVKDWLSAKYKVTIVTSGAQALMYIADNTPDLILLDYEMPSMDGPTVFRMLKEDAETRNIPVMFLTGKNDRELVVKAVDMRPEDYILKSVPKKDLMDKLEDFFKRYKEKMVKLTESD